MSLHHYINASKRRRFQPSMEHFFPPATPATYQHHTKAVAISPSGLLSPSLPAEVQASLLQVGMRIRKSVPEGYKTQDTSKANGIKLHSTSMAPSTTASAAHLTPYCGLHKVGNFHYQQHADEDEDDGYDFISDSAIVSSQESTAAMAPPTTKKRNWSATSEDMHHQINTFRASLSPPLRPIAQPKTRVRSPPTHNAWGGCSYDVMEWEDFEEAQFLKPVEEWKRRDKFAF
ncbi:hypothetical protein MMC13_004227 [Lambiella insularis]|nr:hypothetical protein [Lambiella insularis]